MKERECWTNCIRNTIKDIKICIRNSKARGNAFGTATSGARTVLRKGFRRLIVEGWMHTFKTTPKKTNQSTSPGI
jgi:hypothetical protein